LWPEANATIEILSMSYSTFRSFYLMYRHFVSFVFLRFPNKEDFYLFVRSVVEFVNTGIAQLPNLLIITDRSHRFIPPSKPQKDSSSGYCGEIE
jgi:hypothetical protein